MHYSEGNLDMALGSIEIDAAPKTTPFERGRVAYIDMVSQKVDFS